jgi:ATP-binding cassette subfamily B protein
VALVSGLIGVVQTRMSERIGQGFMHALRVDVFEHVQAQPLSYFTTARTGELQSRVASDVGALEDVVTRTSVFLVDNATTLVATIVAMVVMDVRLTIFALLTVPAFVWAGDRAGRQRKALWTRRQETTGELFSFMDESLSVAGALHAKTSGQDVPGGVLARGFAARSRQLADVSLDARTAGRWSMALTGVCFTSMPALLFLVVGLVLSDGSLTAGTIVAFVTLQSRIVIPMSSLLGVVVEGRGALGVLGRIFSLLDLRAPDAPEQWPSARALSGRAVAVAFDDVWFRYQPGGAWVLRGVSFEARRGSTVAIVGGSGAGKTSIAYLLARLYSPVGGRVLIDGRDVREIDRASLSRQIAYVTQDTFLLHASIADNLRFATPRASDAAVAEASRIAGIHDLILSLPDGYQTVVGERGYRFSGGEKQRLAIARALLRDAPILVLDEATSALDVHTERAVQRALEAFAADRIVVCIAHRLSTVRMADEILVLEQGTIAERGRDLHLRGLGGRYAALIARDAGEPEAARVG